MLVNSPKIYVSWYEDSEPHRVGPFYSVSVDGVDVLSHKWFSLQVQPRPGVFDKLLVPRHFSILAPGN